MTGSDGQQEREAPRRAYVLHLDLEADTLRDLGSALASIEYDLLDGRHERSVTSGGVASGYHLTVQHDSTVTPESYRAALAEYVAALRSARRSS